jgi:hypothetical protein
LACLGGKGLLANIERRGLYFALELWSQNFKASSLQPVSSFECKAF